MKKPRGQAMQISWGGAFQQEEMDSDGNRGSNRKNGREERKWESQWQGWKSEEALISKKCTAIGWFDQRRDCI